MGKLAKNSKFNDTVEREIPEEDIPEIEHREERTNVVVSLKRPSQ